MTESGNTSVADSHSSFKMVMKESDLALKITTWLLNGSNYIIWAKSASLYMCGKSKIEYINDKIKAPQKEDPGYEDWEANLVQRLIDVGLKQSPKLDNAKGKKTTDLCYNVT
ncbi:hypothetical protein EJ110_NYTH08202 [Nymphaea thermarum]|nr:hypothetical protein EJ110_NYTH08202 [Nymphaea thermarum]